MKKTKLKIKVTPRSKNRQITEILEDGTIKIRIKSSPIDGKANHELIEFLSNAFNISRKYISIKSGKSTRRKILMIEGITSREISEIIRKIIKN